MAIVGLANLLVGACVGMTGFAGFLLPMLYAGFFGMPPVEGMALAFSAFVVSGLVGCPAYRRTGDLPLHDSLGLLAGSFVGALLGTRVGLLLPSAVLTVVLYVVVLVSGGSVLVQMVQGRRRARAVAAGDVRAAREVAASVRTPGTAVYVLTGFVTAVICAASGAGGPVLVVPVLLLLGAPARRAVGMSLLDSVAVSLPAAVGYLAGGGISAGAWALLPVALVTHGVGAVAGAANAHRIDAPTLKTVVAVGAVGVALVKLALLVI